MDIRKYLQVPNKSAKSIESKPLQCEDGPNEEKSNTLSHQQEDTCTTLSKSNKLSAKNKKRTREKESAMPESPPTNKRRISKDKSMNSNNNTQTTPSSKMLAQGSILGGADLRSLWTKSVKDLSSSWSSCTKIDYVDLDMNYWNKSAQSFKQNCWFTVKMQTQQKKTNLARISSPLSTSSLPETMADALQATREEANKENQKAQKAIKVKARKKINNTDKEKAERAWKVRLYPTSEEREKLNQWLGIYRWIYNQCVAYHRETKKKPSHQQLRDLFVKDGALEKSDKKWALDLPWDSRDEAAQDFISAIKINEKIYKEKVKKETERLRAQGLKGKKKKHWLKT